MSYIGLLLLKDTGEMKLPPNRFQSFHPHGIEIASKLDPLTKKELVDRDKEECDALLAMQETILHQVEESDCFKLAKQRRNYPSFESSEIVLGPLLGSGGFGVVYEVAEIRLKEEKLCENLGVANTRNPKIDNEEGNQNNKEAGSKGSDGNLSDIVTVTSNGNQEELQHESVHYEVTNAREFMAIHVRRKHNADADSETRNEKGDARYAIKRLHRKLSELKRARAMIDLAIEAKFLSVLWHPNIVKMRGVASGPFVDRHFFIIMDRLYENLGQRMPRWRKSHAIARGCFRGFLGVGVNEENLHQMLVERMVVAYDISAAFAYMHDHRLIYRDIRKENFGFDVRGDIKVFDFGLAKSVNPSLKARDEKGEEVYGYNLTPRTGSIPFMAPEVIMGVPYDEKCDVFSFAILLWEILSLKNAFPGYYRYDLKQRVVKKKERPAIGRGQDWPPLTRLLLQEAWDHNPQSRPDMQRISTVLRGELNTLSEDASIRQRTQHMQSRSQHSFRMEQKKNIDVDLGPP